VEVERGRARGARARRGNDSTAGSGPRLAGVSGGVAARYWRAAGLGRRDTARLTGGPGRDGARSSAAGCRGEAARGGTERAGPGRQREREGNGPRMGRPVEEKEWAEPGSTVVFRIYSY
jgi:hypothetical protein